MPNISNSYICPRCLYKTNLKRRIRRHFYEKKKPCSNETGIDLTDQIKEYVLINYKYKPKNVSKENTINQTVKMYNVYNTIVTNLDIEEKMKLLMNYKNIKILDFEDQLDHQFSNRLLKLEKNGYPNGYYLKEDDLLKIVDSVTKVNKEGMDKFNILFDNTLRRLKLYSCGDWESYLEEIGCKEVIKLIKSYFLDTYELYLIRNLHIENYCGNRFKLKEHLEIYYTFISIFELDPIINTYKDKEILGYNLLEDNEYYLAHTYSKLFYDKKQSVKICDKNKTKRKIINIIKENTQYNLSQLNKTILEILQIDGDFKQEILKLREGF